MAKTNKPTPKDSGKDISHKSVLPKAAPSSKPKSGGNSVQENRGGGSSRQSPPQTSSSKNSSVAPSAAPGNAASSKPTNTMRERFMPSANAAPAAPIVKDYIERDDYLSYHRSRVAMPNAVDLPVANRFARMKSSDQQTFISRSRANNNDIAKTAELTFGDVYSEEVSEEDVAYILRMSKESNSRTSSNQGGFAQDEYGKPKRFSGRGTYASYYQPNEDPAFLEELDELLKKIQFDLNNFVSPIGESLNASLTQMRDAANNFVRELAMLEVARVLNKFGNEASESVLSFVLDYTSALAANNIPLSLYLYEGAINMAYGVDITTIETTPDPGEIDYKVPELDYLALNNYHLALEQYAVFFNNQIESEDQNVPFSVNVDQYALFRAVMGNITIVRTDVRPIATVEGKETTDWKGNGLSQGHTINDIFDKNRLGYLEYPDLKIDPMTVRNFIHELAHSFNTFSGFGSFNLTPTIRLSSTQTLLDALDALGEKYRENPSPDPSEILADYILNVITGNISNPVNLDISIRQAILYHTKPEDYAKVLGGSAYLPSVIGTGIRFRLNSPIIKDTFDTNNLLSLYDSGNNAAVESFEEGKEVGTLTVLAITEEEIIDTQTQSKRWVYIVISDGQSNKYLWAREDTIDSLTPIDWDKVAVIPSNGNTISPFMSLDPYRPFDPYDPFNP